MHRFFPVAALLTLAAAVPAVAIPAIAAESMPAATADMVDPAGKALGTITLRQYPDGIVVHGEVTGLTPGWHAIHIHENGACTPDFNAAGGHFNPLHGSHGLAGQPAHAGDLPNIWVDAQGHAAFEAITERVTLGDGANSLFKAGGSSVIIHANPDDYVSQPVGNAGGRAACGVVRKG